MSFIPTFNLYASDGVSLVYAFEHIIDTNWPQDNPSSIELTNTRSSGAIIIPEGDKPYDIFLKGIILGDNYTDITTKMFALKDAIVANTRYVLTLDKSVSTLDTIKVMRTVTIEFEESKRISNQKYTIRLRALSWA